ncbi:hypothetical protein PCE1_001186 [Barthelona sp. PCE]
MKRLQEAANCAACALVSSEGVPITIESFNCKKPDYHELFGFHAASTTAENANARVKCVLTEGYAIAFNQTDFFTICIIHKTENLLPEYVYNHITECFKQMIKTLSLGSLRKLDRSQLQRIGSLVAPSKALIREFLALLVNDYIRLLFPSVVVGQSNENHRIKLNAILDTLDAGFVLLMNNTTNIVEGKVGKIPRTLQSFIFPYLCTLSSYSFCSSSLPVRIEEEKYVLHIVKLSNTLSLVLLTQHHIPIRDVRIAADAFGLETALPTFLLDDEDDQVIGRVEFKSDVVRLGLNAANIDFILNQSLQDSVLNDSLADFHSMLRNPTSNPFVSACVLEKLKKHNPKGSQHMHITNNHILLGKESEFIGLKVDTPLWDVERFI